MDNGQPQTQRPNLLKLGVILAALIVVLVVAFFAWHSHSKSSKEQSALPAGWSEYKATNYGFKFDYPTAWGTPSVVDDSTVKLPAPAPKTVKQTGKRYNITFSNMLAAQQSDPKVMITLTSINYENTSCTTSKVCGNSVAFTSKNVKKNLNNKALLSHDAVSTAELHYSGGMGILYIEQIVNLPKINATAATLTYLLPQASSSCKTNTLSGDENCITTANYNDSNKLVKSIKSI